MVDSEKSFKLIVLRSPFLIWEKPEVQQMFSAMVGLKKAGYTANYAAGVLPVDTTDFIATHVILCSQAYSRLTPVMGYKVTTLADCLAFNLAFPGLSLVRSAQASEHTKAVEEIVRRCEDQGLGLGYLGSWTVDPKFKRDSGLAAELREIFVATYGHLFRDLNTSEILIGGTPRFHTERVFRELGHRPLARAERQLPEIHVAHLVGEPVLVMHARHNPTVRRPAESKWQALWEGRLDFGTRAQLALKAG